MDMKEKLKRQKMKKYALIGLVLIIILSLAVGFTIEKKDSKLADGQGQVITNNEGDALEEGDSSDESATSDEALDESEDDQKEESSDKEKDDKKDEEKSDSTNSDKNSNSDKKDSKSDSNKTVKDKVKEAETASDIKLTEEEKKETDSKDIKVDNSDDPSKSNGGNEALKPEEAKNVTVTLEIRCNTLSEHMEYLENDALKSYIPEDGIILAKTTYKGTTENTVFDVLNTLCRNNDIQLEFSYTPIYESNYVEGINFLYEFDGGPQSGWMYSVNGWFPNYGASAYYLSDGDEIVWAYTCKGYGADLGATVNG